MCNTKLVQKLAFAYLLANTLADLSLQVSHRTRKHPESAHLRRRWPYLSNVNVNVNVEFKVTLHDQVRCRGTILY